MIYLYACEKCDIEFDVSKPLSDLDRAESCTNCGNIASRQVTAPMCLIGTAVESPEYNHGLGCVTKSSKHRAEIAKSRGLVEIGSDFSSSEKLQNHYDKVREDKRNKSYEDI